MMETVQILKEGHENFKKSSQENIQTLSKKYEDLLRDNLELKNEIQTQRSKNQTLESQLQKAEEASKQTLGQLNAKRSEQDSQAPISDSGIMTEMLEKVLKLEKEANNYKYKSQRLAEDLLKATKQSSQQTNLLYSIIFDLTTASLIPK